MERNREQTARRYLLGQSTEAERHDIEERAFTDAAFFEELGAFEDELIDSYVRGELSRADRAQFVSYCLPSPKMQERIGFSRELNRRVTPAESLWRRWVRAWSSQSLWMRVALPGLAALLIVAGVTWMAWPGGPHSGAPIEIARKHPVKAPTVFSFLLVPGSTRAPGDANRQMVPKDAAVIRMDAQLPRGGSFQSYQAVLKSPEGTTVWSGPAITARPGFATVEIPADQLPAGDYILTLSGAQPSREIADYTFRIVRQ